MLITVDVGNTNTVIGVYEGTALRHHWRLSTDQERTTDEHGALLNTLLRGRGHEHPAAARRGRGRLRGAAAQPDDGRALAALLPLRSR